MSTTTNTKPPKFAIDRAADKQAAEDMVRKSKELFASNGRMPLNYKMHLGERFAESHPEKFSLSVTDPYWNGQYVPANVLYQILQSDTSIFQRDWMGVIDGVKDKRDFLKYTMAECGLQAWTCNVPTDPTNDAFTSVQMEVKRLMYYREDCIDTLFDKFLNNIPGDYANLHTGEFPVMIQDIFLQKSAYQIDLQAQRVWMRGSASYPAGQSLGDVCTINGVGIVGFLGQLEASSEVTKINSPVLTTANILAQLEAIWLANNEPLNNVADGDKVLLMNSNTYKLYKAALAKDPHTNYLFNIVPGANATQYEGVNIDVLSNGIMPDNTIVYTFKRHPQHGYNNLNLVTDFMNGMEDIEVGRKENAGRKIFLRADFAMGVFISNLEAVVYSATTV